MIIISYLALRCSIASYGTIYYFEFPYQLNDVLSTSCPHHVESTSVDNLHWAFVASNGYAVPGS